MFLVVKETSYCYSVYMWSRVCCCINKIFHAIWLRNVLQELQIVQEEPTKIYIDNKSTLALAKNPLFHERSKHIDTWYHFIQEHVKEKQIELVAVKSQDNVFDIFTKPLKHEVFALLREQLGMTRSSLREDVEN